jgi:excisionase family DNA binding protein
MQSDGGTHKADNHATLLISVTDAAARLGIGLSSVKELIKAGKLPSVKLLSRRLVRVGDLEAFVEALEGGGDD